MFRRGILFVVMTASSCAPGEELTSAQETVLRPQGMSFQGMSFQGMSFQGMSFQSHLLGEVTLSGDSLENARVERGELVAERRLEVIGTTESLGPCASPETGIKRGCGWVSEGLGGCTPGETVVLGASELCGLGSCTGDPMLRVCKDDQPCEWVPPSPDLAPTQGLIGDSDDACGGDCPQVEFTCPQSGTYNVMSAAYDSSQSYSVNIAVSQGAFPLRETLRNTDLVGAELVGETLVGDRLDYRIAQVEPEDPAHDPTGTGHTWLYTLEHLDPATGEYVVSCLPDAEDRQVAIPIGATWDGTASRVESESHFTFACTAGALGKCYRWGYRPWLLWDPSAPELMARVHQACTRMARADYCGDGQSFTKEGTLINIWDILDPVIQHRGDPGPEWFLEAGWDEDGAVCLSKSRWATLNPVPECQDKLRPPGAGRQATTCESAEEALKYNPGVRLFNDTQKNVK